MGVTPVPQGALGRIPDGPGLSDDIGTLPLSSGDIRTTAGFSGDFWTLSSRKGGSDKKLDTHRCPDWSPSVPR